jgi:hypothetical protein
MVCRLPKFKIPRGYILLIYLSIKSNFDFINSWDEVITKPSKKKTGYIIIFVKRKEFKKYMLSLSENPNVTS